MVSVVFRVNYFTESGQTIAIVGNISAFGQWNTGNALKMNYVGEGNWQLEFRFTEENSGLKDFSYFYLVRSSFGWSFCEHQGISGRVLPLHKLVHLKSVFIEDIWQSPTVPFLNPNTNSSLFTKVIFKREKILNSVPLNSIHCDADSILVNLKVHAVHVPPKAMLRVCGDCSELGNWVPLKAPCLSNEHFPFWELTLSVKKSHVPFRYKFVFCLDSPELVTWELGENRLFSSAPCDVCMISCGSFREREDTWRGTGLSIPIFSIRTSNSLGVGEFLDLKPLADWAAQCGFKLIQILPINDTSVNGDWKDSYPYSALSVFALHPMYISLNALVDSSPGNNSNLIWEINSRKDLNEMPQVDYEEVVSFKDRILHILYNKHGDAVLKSDEFCAWFSANEGWLAPYALFCVLRDTYHTSDYSKWEHYQSISEEGIRLMTSKQSKSYHSIGYYYYVQYNLHLQLKEATVYATKRGIALKGDIAIGVSPRSVDTWAHPRLFHLDKQTGAPPDMFSKTGQNWKFPTYNWEEMAKDDYTWWRSRLANMAQYFDAFRVDHILGFFRIWEIPGNCVTGLLGRFNPSIPIHRDELISRGLWNLNRFCKPYVRTHLLEAYFGVDAALVQERFFEEIDYSSFQFKPEFFSEKQIAMALPIDPSLDPEKIKTNQRWKEGLFKLIQNVILLQDDKDPNAFYPRIAMTETSSFEELNFHEKTSFQWLYVDYFYHRQESLWSRVALERLPVIVNTTKMLCCGEDLGMVPNCVDPVMRQLRILSLRIQRMPDDPAKIFMHPSEYPYLSVCTPSVHDTSTLRGWWEENPSLRQRFYNEILGQNGTAPAFCDASISYRIIRQHLESRSMLAIFAIQDLFGLNFNYFCNRNPKEERINIPSVPEHYWRYRMHISVEDLIKDTPFCEHIKELIRSTGRLSLDSSS